MDMNPLWAWLFLLFIWCAVLMLLGLGLRDTFHFMEYVIFISFCCLMLVVVAAAVLGSVQWLEYNQAWPFTPE